MAGSVRTALSQSRSALCRVGTCQFTSRRSYPLCRLETNMTQNDLPKDLSSGLAGVVAKTFNKLETNTVVSIHSDVSMYHEGTKNPSVLLHIWHENNKNIAIEDDQTTMNNVQESHKHAREIFEYLMPKLDLPYNRINLMLHSRPSHDFAHLIYGDLVQVCQLP